MHVLNLNTAVPSGSLVDVVCEGPNFPASFDINVTASSNNGGCRANKTEFTPVVVNTRPSVAVQGPPADQHSDVCIIPGTPPTKNLTFTVSSTGAPANVTLASPGADCVASPSSISK